MLGTSALQDMYRSADFVRRIGPKSPTRGNEGSATAWKQLESLDS